MSAVMTWFESFSTYLDIRIQYELECNRAEADRALERLYGPDIYGLLEERHYAYLDQIKEWTYERVRRLAYTVPVETIHPLIATVPELVDAWAEGKRYREEEQWEEERAQKTKEREAVVEQKINAKDWEGLGLPSPAELLAGLSNGESSYVGGHSLNPDEDGVWVTNPYGHDCALWQDITLESIEEFLIDMARGEEYGPVPN